ncbi:hypothetical protein EIP91_009557 [Steccherinum ochraceum]|uniref:Uncharacterized protein n=1 Tax=Steccherinum ochraceum TaxID=92696 RepID=A0A4R0RP04_9APHY|nr:hypothetical protein EIP91_009557 [Steccherinum ochraceum]
MPSNRVALITGGAQGIGEAIAIRFAEDPSGIDVALLDVKGKESLLVNVVRHIEAKGRKAIWITGDVTIEEDVKAAVDKTVAELGSLDIMVANAGVTLFKPFVDTTTEDWTRVHSINVQGLMYCYKYSASQMIKQGKGGRIIGAGSGAGKRGNQNMTAYSASKFAVRGLTQATVYVYITTETC